MNARLNRIFPLILILFSIIPTLGALLRLSQIGGYPIELPDSLRVLNGPRLPLLIHIVGSMVFIVFGSFQFSDWIRARRSHLHRAMGLIVVPAALATGFSAIWLTLFFPHAPHDNALLNIFRITAGSILIFATFAGIWFIRKRNILAHRQWMSRAYAIGSGTGLQGLVIVIWHMFTPDLSGDIRALVFAGCWLTCLIIVETKIRTSAIYAQK